jgi:UDP:flavonoid glycosyltransferase YjiC (YdhE family)
MARILAYTTPGRGHLYPLIPILGELRRGHQVVLRTLAAEAASMCASVGSTPARSATASRRSPMTTGAPPAHGRRWPRQGARGDPAARGRQTHPARVRHRRRAISRRDAFETHLLHRNHHRSYRPDRTRHLQQAPKARPPLEVARRTEATSGYGATRSPYRLPRLPVWS